MYAVLVEECTDEASQGAYVYDSFSEVECAQRTARVARAVYPFGTAWVEDSSGNVIPEEGGAT